MAAETDVGDGSGPPSGRRRRVPVYDSDATYRPIVTELEHFWRYRGLLRLLVVREVTVRYKRSVIGVWWTLLNPLVSAAVFWLVFSQLFRGAVAEAPFAVYLLSGILFSTAFSQGIVASGEAIVQSRGVLTKMFVPAEIFSVAAAIAAMVNFTISLIPLVLVQIVTGHGVPWTVVLVPIPVLALTALVAGAGLLVASLAVKFFDVIPLVTMLAGLIALLIPTFYPIDIVPERFQPLIKANPLFSYLEVFRGFMYGAYGGFAPPWMFAVMVVTAGGAVVCGVWVFSRTWRRNAALL